MKPTSGNQETTALHSATHVLILTNPKAGRGPKAEFADQLGDCLRKEGLQPKIVDSLETLATESAQLAERGILRCVVAIGGDGTVRAVANCVSRIGVAGAAPIPIAVVPMGTENLLARQFGMTSDLAAVGVAIKARRVQAIDAGRVNDELFLIMVSCGFDADVIWRLHQTRKGNISHFSYAKPILRSLWRYRFPALRLTAENTETGIQAVIESHWVFAFNLPNYARGLPIALEADAQDGQLDVVSFHGGSRLAGLFHLATVLFRQHGRWSGCHRERFTRLRIEANEPVPYQVDGDAGGFLPVEVEVLPGHVSIILPA
jgi:diacylglycerol kinase (ATP)